MNRRIAMWSGPRNLSTAMMRSFQSRADCAVSDEPLYAHYLNQTQIQHPGFEEIVRSQSTDWKTVTNILCGEIPDQHPIWYQKHMTHHFLENIEKEWLSNLSHAFLIRKPALVVASYAKTRSEVTLADLGFVQQTEIFRYVTDQLQQPPIVIDSDDILKNPARTLRKLCQKLDIQYTDAMLHWPAGKRKEDGVWAKTWYHNVEQSTGFAPWKEKKPQIPTAYQHLVEEAESHYRELWNHRIQ